MAKDSYLNSFVFNFDSKGQIINRLMTYAYYGYPLDFRRRQQGGRRESDQGRRPPRGEEISEPDKVQILVVGKSGFRQAAVDAGTVNVIDITIPAAKK